MHLLHIDLRALLYETGLTELIPNFLHSVMSLTLPAPHPRRCSQRIHNPHRGGMTGITSLKQLSDLFLKLGPMRFERALQVTSQQ